MFNNSRNLNALKIFFYSLNVFSVKVTGNFDNNRIRAGKIAQKVKLLSQSTLSQSMVPISSTKGHLSTEFVNSSLSTTGSGSRAPSYIN